MPVKIHVIQVLLLTHLQPKVCLHVGILNLRSWSLRLCVNNLRPAHFSLTICSKSLWVVVDINSGKSHVSDCDPKLWLS